MEETLFFQNCNTVLAVYVTVNSVCWTLIDRSKYEVVEWEYKPIQYPEGKNLKMTDILDLVSCSHNSYT